MHETDMTKALILTVKNWWNSQPEPYKIDKIHLIVGKFTCVEPVSLQFAFEVQTRNTFLEGVILEIQETPLIAYCHTCQTEYCPEIGLHYACPTCQSPMEDIRSGRELKIDRIEYSIAGNREQGTGNREEKSLPSGLCP
ncbi:hydrogenase maturation nickel metallochaperone HypA [Planktothrix agardhii 1029]|jgi:hydrogenase nickel incorporation protein HypA/HybF|uniref:hydrogenase maturation nickel metallochaperone HypA n=1 Tax=Planktothrix agardhii TaxID=1160 RepID=UPI001D09BB63|nr:hydrogenase maturation nickel metallochaperone HypA [Planktothrix agardhii]MCF3607529.1 hydrogenase maturation nickel metallochaperone HypA [Planktothrix agardhii 1033]MCB8762609.1 hydrogenase maturation nickel metallochaperone HypA [Planktothrix agardhii 1809]MCB8763585.1 hydrogenase maturation nickel metallochaperone HypA [Planktothrix agardhii 1809]MCB8777241.1 hydrogenase maturation nickel metallochaperone HypA [Planktothrix agardhii 1031]MCB8781665.1 hydrogenase maturation nickel metal